MKRFILLVALVCFVGDALAQKALLSHVSNVGTKFKNFFVSDTRSHSGLQSLIAALAITGVSCAGITGCAVKHDVSNARSVEAVQMVSYSLSIGAFVGILINNYEYSSATQGFYKDRERSIDSTWLLVPLSTFVMTYLWDVSAVYVYPDKALLPEPQRQTDFAQRSQVEAELRNYLRTQLPPPKYDSLFSNVPVRKDGWIAISTQADILSQVDPLAELAASIASAEAVYYGQHDAERGLFNFDTVKHADAETAQALEENEVFSLIAVSSEQ